MTPSEAANQLHDLHCRILGDKFAKKVYWQEIQALLMAIQALEAQGTILKCPSCGLEVHSDFNECPRCGANMSENPTGCNMIPQSEIDDLIASEEQADGDYISRAQALNTWCKQECKHDFDKCLVTRRCRTARFLLQLPTVAIPKERG